jgi:hypothetical protein
MEGVRHTRQPYIWMAGYESSFQSDPPGAPTLGARPDHGWLFVLSHLFTRVNSYNLSKMAALEEVLVSDLNKMSAEELRSRGWALRSVQQ